MAGANEAEQTLRGAEQTAPEQTAPRPEIATGQVPEPAGGTMAEPTIEQVAKQAPEQAPQAPGFGERGRMRRRARFLRKARELAYRDLGGLVFDLHRFGQRNDQLVLAKLATLGQIDTEVRELEEVLRDRRPVTVLREVGIAACPRCAAIHGSDDRFCPGCGLAFDANADRLISTAPVNQQAQPAPAPRTSPPAPAPAFPRVSTPASAPAQVSASPSATAPGPPPAQASTSPPVTAPGPPPAQASTSPPAQASAPPAPTPAMAQAPTSAHTAAAPAPMQAPTTVQPPPVKPSAAPVAAKPASPPAAAPAKPEQKKPEQAEEDEPTQILRPPATGA